MSNKLPKTKTDVSNDGRYDLLRIYKVDDDGEEIEKFPKIIKFGVTKAKHILANIDNIEKFVEEYDK